MMRAFEVVFVCTVLSCVLVGLMRILALRVGILDAPNSRSSHGVETARGGGVVIAVLTIAAVLLEYKSAHLSAWVACAWAAGGGVVAAVGFCDDLWGLPAGVRAAVHVLAACLLVYVSAGLPSLPTPSGPVQLGPAGWIVAALAVVWSTNLYNFMDGIDGIAATQCIFVTASVLVLAGLTGSALSVQIPLLALAGSTAGFLIWNHSPARIFMGDVGSGFIGFSLAAGALLTANRGAINLWTWLALNGLFLADATTTLLVRLIDGQRIYQAHRSHAYQRLARRWKSHGKVTALCVAINVLWCLPWAVLTVFYPGHGWLWSFVSLVPLFAIALMVGAGRADSWSFIRRMQSSRP
jgi:Fuc2NAc and GlcNAc transferase